jgi:drug/metabolite transporter (DMT)-like permease
MKRNQMLTGMGLATLAALLWALALGASFLVPATMPTAQLLTGRYGVQVLLLVGLVMPVRGTSLVRTARPEMQILRGLSMLVMPFAFTFATHRIGIADAWAALWLGPLFGVVAAGVLLKESASFVAALAAIVATAGAVLVHAPAGPASPAGVLSVIVAAASFGVFLALTRALREERSTTGLLWTAVCVFLPSLVLTPFGVQALTLRAVVGIVAMGAIWLLVLWAIDGALRRAPLVMVVPFLLTEIVWVRLMIATPWPRRAIAGALALALSALTAMWLAWRRQPVGAIRPENAAA